MEDQTKENLKKVGLVSLAIASPPIYIAQNEIRNGNYETGWGRAIGTTLSMIGTAFACFVGSLVLNGAGDVSSQKNGIVSEQQMEEPGRNLAFKQREYDSFNDKMALRSFLFPIEGPIRRYIIGNYPQTRDTSFSGIVSSKGLEFSVEGELGGWRDVSEITDQELTAGTKKAIVAPKIYEEIYKRD